MTTVDKLKRNQYLDIPNAYTSSGLPWYKFKSLRQLNFFVSVIFMTQVLNGFDDNLIGGFQALTPWMEALENPTRTEIGLLTSAAYIAGFFTAFVARYVADRFGRRWCVRYSALTMVVGATLGTLSGVGHASGYGLFLASRIVIGSGVSFALMIAPILLQELPHPLQRVQIAGLLNCNYAVGAFIASWTCFGCSYITNNWSWRIPYLVQLIPALYMLFCVQFVPETPRWYMSKGMEKEAMDFLVKYHGDGNPNDELVLFEFEEMKEALEFERTAHQADWKELFGTRGNLHRLSICLLIVVCQNLSGTAIIQNYYTQILDLVGITSAQQQTGINAGMTVLTFAAAILGVWMTGRVKRRPMLMWTWVALIIVNVCFVITSARYVQTGTKAAAYANIVFLWFYDAVFFIVCGPLFFSYQAECLSYTIRAKGMMLWGNVLQLISIFNAYVNSIALDNIGWKYYIVYTVLLTVQLIFMYFLCVETSGLTLEEISVLFDGEKSDPTPHMDAAHIKKSFEADVAEKVDDSAEEDGDSKSEAKEVVKTEVKEAVA